jgi:hypothetical protein
MNTISLDAELSEKLRALTETVELCNESGEVLGHFVPAMSTPDDEYLEPEISREELLLRMQSTQWYTTAEVLAHLERLQ